ncbi:MAG: 16S rRNA (guanine(966)-N(2))-methyltransferase RsmD [Thermodesulfobacteriota bacterium]|nr:16S rRNA (guanine(966)-N(2))-methyltransferase RsmD [Thermodesulfobacteriota bacterium]
MRIISGHARGTQLATFDGKDIRPTSDRVRGAIFSILTSQLGSFNQLRILDIFAGTGAMGLEALSRCAAEAIFIDQGQQANKLIQTNYRRCHCDSNYHIIKQSAQKALPRLQGQCFDVIFIDPPYGKNLLPEIIQLIGQYQLLAPAGIICAEEQKKTLLPQQIAHYNQIDRRRYGATEILLYKNTGTETLPQPDKD